MVRLNFKRGMSRIVLITLSLATLGLNSACGTAQTPVNNVVTKVTLRSYEVGTDDWVEMVATLATGGFQLASINLPVIDPRKPSTVYGKISLVPNLNPGGGGFSGGELTIALNVTAASGIQGLGATLPNGTPLPVGGLQNASVIDLPIADTGARLYFAFGPGVAMLGAAMAFSALDPAGQYIPGVNLFQPLTFGPVSLTAGFFAGSAPKTTGIGLFIDLSGVINQNPTSIASAEFAGTMKKGMRKQTRSKLTFSPIMPSAEDEQTLYGVLFDLSQKGVTLKLDE